MKINGVEIEDTFAEAFQMWMARVLITAESLEWAYTAARSAVGFGTSVIMCPSECGIDVEVPSEKTPDGRPGVTIIICTSKKKSLGEQLLARISQCVLTAPTTAAFNALEDPEITFPTGRQIRYFGDGFEEKGEIGGRTVWKIPVMEGEFIIEETFGGKKGVAGGNFLILSENLKAGLEAAKRAVDVISKVEGVITPFPGGICRSGSKVGSLKYKFMHASTNHQYCPTLREKVTDSKIPEGVNCVYEIVINGLTLESVKEAMAVGIREAAKVPGVKMISAGNYGGKLGQYKIHLHELFK
ncbi:MAG: formylmethanofuran--tetrahydromethanopterin N-formyltransferase [Candidatus Baldrarchaeia archaeon]